MRAALAQNFNVDGVPSRSRELLAISGDSPDIIGSVRIDNFSWAAIDADGCFAILRPELGEPQHRLPSNASSAVVPFTLEAVMVPLYATRGSSLRCFQSPP